MSEQVSWWEVLKAPLAFLSAPVMLKAFEWWSSRHERREAKAGRTADRQAAVLLAERELLDRGQREMDRRAEVERAYVASEAERLRAERRTLERDRDRGWTIARFYYRMACDMEHAVNNARQVANYSLSKLDPPEPPVGWPEFNVPAEMEAPFPIIER